VILVSNPFMQTVLAKVECGMWNWCHWELLEHSIWMPPFCHWMMGVGKVAAAHIHNLYSLPLPPK